MIECVRRQSGLRLPSMVVVQLQNCTWRTSLFLMRAKRTRRWQHTLWNFGRHRKASCRFATLVWNEENVCFKVRATRRMLQWSLHRVRGQHRSLPPAALLILMPVRPTQNLCLLLLRKTCACASGAIDRTARMSAWRARLARTVTPSTSWRVAFVRPTPIRLRLCLRGTRGTTARRAPTALCNQTTSVSFTTNQTKPAQSTAKRVRRAAGARCVPCAVGDARQAGCRCGRCAARCADCLRYNALRAGWLHSRGALRCTGCDAWVGALRCTRCDAMRCAQAGCIRAVRCAARDAMRGSVRCAARDAMQCAARGLVAFAWCRRSHAFESSRLLALACNHGFVGGYHVLN
jgi:hypothetical protein